MTGIRFERRSNGFMSSRILVTALIATVVGAGLWAILTTVSRGGADAPGDNHAAAAPATAGIGGTMWAKDAAAKGKWTSVTDTMAAGGAYVTSGGEGVGTSLEFPIEVDKPTVISVKPLWFVHGDQTKARRFPDTSPYFAVQQEWSVEKNVWLDAGGDGKITFPVPMYAKPGPDSIVALKDNAYFTAPVGGKIGILDLGTSKITGTIDVGGYIADIVADAARGELLVADAARSRVSVFTVKDNQKVADIPVPELPYSLAMDGGKLYVACMAAKKIAVVDVAGRKITKTVDLPVGPQNVAIAGEGGKKQLIVHLLPLAYDMKTFKEILADRLTYWPSWPYLAPPETYETEAMAKASAAFPKARIKTFFYGRHPVAKMLDAGPSWGFCRVGYTPDQKNKVFIVDDSFKGLIIFHVDTGESKKIELAEAPAAFSQFDMKIYAFCKQARKVQVVDLNTEKLVDTRELPLAASEFFAGVLVPKFSTAEYFTGYAVQQGAVDGRVIIGPTPLAFDLATLSPAATPDLPFFPYDRHTKVATGNGAAMQLSVDNLQTIRVEDKAAPTPSVHYIDTGAVTDYHIANNPAVLMPGDQPGAVTLRLDEGPECDWENDVWFAPDSRMMLTRGSEEFDLWNGVRFSLPPGKHVLKVTSHSKYANLEGLQVTRTLAGVVSAKFSPLTEDVQGKVTIPGYGGVFLADEDAAFRVCFTNQAAADVNLKCRWTALDYRGKEALTGDFDLTAATGKETAHELKLDVKEPGRYVIRLKYSSPEGEHEVFHRFVKLPKLDYPRLVMRAEESQQVRDRIAKYPVMFQRYRDYLRRQSEKKDFMPVKFRGSWGQDQTLENAKWRAICLGFADNFLEGENPKRYEDKLLPLLTDPGGYDAWQGNYEFGGPQTLLYDLMLGSSKGARSGWKNTIGRRTVGFTATTT